MPRSLRPSRRCGAGTVSRDEPAVRVIAGEAKGRTLIVPKGGGTRSATDRIRETLFAILSTRVEDARVLDLFAGAGTLGIESLSRGAASATFVEHGREAIVALGRNLAATGYADRSRVVRSDVIAYLERSPDEVDLVFCDPPFADVELLGRVLAHQGLRRAAEGALIVARVMRKHPPAIPDTMKLARERIVGEETLLMLEYIRA